MANTSLRGFASMDAAKQREIASKGGKAAHTKGTAHEWSSDEARNAGRKGGEAVSRDRAHMAAIGREGGEASRGRARRKSSDISTDIGQTASGSDREIGRPVSREDDRSTLDRNTGTGSLRPSDDRNSDSAA